MIRLLLAFLLLTFVSCDREEDPINDKPPVNENYYFPSVDGTEWETSSPDSLGWNSDVIPELYDELSTKGTRAFILLKNGKIVLEKYWGNNILNTAPFDQDDLWYWASAGKTLTAFLVGLAQQEGDLDINDKTSDYLGQGWTGIEQDKENQILIRHQLTMTSGLDYTAGNLDCTNPECLLYKEDPGKQWYYHNAPYTLLESVVSNASGISYNDFTDIHLEDRIGFKGNWIPSGFLNVYWSTARDAARFGLLMLNKGTWDETRILTDSIYFYNMTNPSQDLNPAYGYLTWLNGQNSIVYPGLPFPIHVSLSANAPDDLFAGLGKNGQFVDVVPSEGIVMIRFGEAPDGALVPVQFHNEIWKILSDLIY